MLNNATCRICQKYNVYLDINDSWKDHAKAADRRNSSSHMQPADSARCQAYILVRGTIYAEYLGRTVAGLIQSKFQTMEIERLTCNLQDLRDMHIYLDTWNDVRIDYRCSHMPPAETTRYSAYI